MSFGAGTDQITISGTNTLDLDDITGLENIVTAATTGVDTVAITFDAVTTNTAAQTITVDASAMTGTSDNLTVTNNSALAATTFNITGSTGGDTLNGGAGGDTISGVAATIICLAVAVLTRLPILKARIQRPVVQETTPSPLAT